MSESSDEQTLNFTDDDMEDFPDECKQSFLFHFDLSTLFLAVLCPDVLLERPVEDQIERNIVIVDQMPIIDRGKLTKFRMVMQRIFQPIGNVCNDFYPFGDDGKSKG